MKSIILIYGDAPQLPRLSGEWPAELDIGILDLFASIEFDATALEELLTGIGIAHGKSLILNPRYKTWDAESSTLTYEVANGKATYHLDPYDNNQTINRKMQGHLVSCELDVAGREEDEG